MIIALTKFMIHGLPAVTGAVVEPVLRAVTIVICCFCFYLLVASVSPQFLSDWNCIGYSAVFCSLFRASL